MAGITDVARYILEQKGSTANSVLQELCRLTAREGLLKREPVVFEGEFELIISDTYPNGEICRELYNACSDEFVSAETLKGGDSSLLSTEEKLIINEALNKYYSRIKEKTGSSVYHAEDIYSDFSDEGGFTRSFNCLTEDELTEPTRYFPVQNHEYEETSFLPDPENSDYSGFSSDESSAVKETGGENNTDGTVKNQKVYAQETMAMPDVSSFNELTGNDADKTAPINYRYKETVPVKEQIKKTVVGAVGNSANNTGKSHHTQPKAVTQGHANSGSAGAPVHKAPLPASVVRKERKKKENRNLNLFIAWLTAVIIILVILLLNATLSSGSDKKQETEYVVTQAETLEKPAPVPVEETEQETEPVTEPPETETEISEETTVPETEAETEAETETEVTASDYRDNTGAGDGRRVLDSYVSADINGDGKNDMLEVYKYNTDDFFYDIRYSDGSVITYTFPNGDSNRTLDYIVYDHKMDSVYAAGLNISDSGIRFTQINSVTRFSVEYGNGEKSFFINYSAGTADEVRDYFDNIDVIYSFGDRNASEFSKIIKEALK